MGAGPGRLGPPIEITPLRVALCQRFGVDCILRPELRSSCAIAASRPGSADGRRPLRRDDRADCREVCWLVVIDLATHVVGSDTSLVEVSVAVCTRFVSLAAIPAGTVAAASKSSRRSGQHPPAHCPRRCRLGDLGGRATGVPRRRLLRERVAAAKGVSSPRGKGCQSTRMEDRCFPKRLSSSNRAVLIQRPISTTGLNF